MSEADMISGAASSALPQSNATGGPGQNPAQVQQLLQILSSIGKPQGPSGPLTTAQSNIPTPIPRQVQPINAPQVPQGTFGSRGEAKRASKQAMMNNIATIGNQIVKMDTDKKTREMTQLVTQIQGATTGKQQAEATLKQDPNNTEAKAQLKQNQDILSDIFSDPANGKKIQKAFNVKLMGDDKGQATPEYKGLMAAIKNQDKTAQQQAGGQLAQKFQQSFPSTQQLSPQMQGQAALIKLGIQPRAGEQLKAQTDMVKEVVNYTKTLDTTASREKIAQMLVDTKDTQMKNDIIKTSMQVAGRQGTAQILATATVKRAGIMANAAEQDTQWKMAGQILTTKMKTDSSNKALSVLSTEYQRTQTELKNLSKEATDADSKWFNSENTKAITDKINTTRQRQGTIIKRMEQLNLMKDADAAGNSTTADGPGNTDTKQNEESSGFDKFFGDLINAPDPQ